MNEMGVSLKTFLSCYSKEGYMELITILGLTAGTLTTVSLLPQVIRITKMKETRDLSSYTYEILAIGMLLWLLYGAFTVDLPIILANAVSLVLTLTILYYKFKFG